MTFGIIPAGFNRKDAETITTELENYLKSARGEDFDVSIDTPQGALIGLMSEKLSELWELAEDLYYSPFPDYATDNNLDDSVSRVAVSRVLESKSICKNVTLTNTTGSPALIPVGSIARQSTTLTEWETMQEVTIPAGGSVDVDFICTKAGAITAGIGSINTIVNTITGWSSVSNSQVAIVGKNRETDSELRRRRAISLIRSKGGIVAAIANRVFEEVEGVTYVSWRENRTDATVDGMPKHTFEIIVEGGLDQDIAEKINEASPAGIESFGTETVNITDVQDNTFTIKFSRITQVDIYLIINLVTDSNYPLDGDDLIKNALVNEIFERGQDIFNWKLDGSFRFIPGINSVEILQGIAPAPATSNNISISNNQRAVILESNITVNS